MQSVSENPILSALVQYERGVGLDDLLVMRDRLLPTPQAWLDAGWEALGYLDANDERAAMINSVMQWAWKSVGPVGQCARRPWLNEMPRGAQGLWQQSILHGRPS